MSSEEIIVRAFTSPPPQDFDPALWADQDPVVSHFLNALSTQFPIGEAYFIRAVQPFVESISDKQLLLQVQVFIEQERNHSLEHARLNAFFKKYDLSKMDRVQALRSKKALQIYSPEFNLALTAAYEHLTASAAYAVLTGRDLYQSCPEVAALFYWHCLEELEHKSVVFRLYETVGMKRWCLLVGFVEASVLLYLTTMSRLLVFLHKDGMLWKAKTWKSLVGLHLRRQGLIRRMLGEALRFLKPGFHPDERDDRALLALWEQRLSSHVQTLKNHSEKNFAY